MHISFIISEEERNRILGIHEQATKRQYLIEDNYQELINPKKTYNIPKNAEPSDNRSIASFGKPKGWEYYPCVINNSQARGFKLNNGETAYQIGDVQYYSDGTRSKKRWESFEHYPFSCQDEEFIGEYEAKNKDVRWGRYPCLTNNQNAEKITLRDGTTAYDLNGERYFSSGRKTVNGTSPTIPFTCEDPEFKEQSQPESTPESEPISKEKGQLNPQQKKDKVKKRKNIYLGNETPDMIFVKETLKKLNKLPENIIIDNKYDKETYKIIRQFQKENHLKVDGIIGPNTWRTLVNTQLEDIQSIGLGNMGNTPNEELRKTIQQPNVNANNQQTQDNQDRFSALANVSKSTSQTIQPW